MKGSKSGQVQNPTTEKPEPSTLLRSRSVINIPSTSYSSKEKEKLQPTVKTRKHKIEPDQTFEIEYEPKYRKNSKHNIDTQDIQVSNNLEASSSTDIKSKNKLRKHRKSSSQSPSGSKKREEGHPQERNKEDKSHRLSSINFSSKSELNLKDKAKKTGKRGKGNSTFNLRHFTSEVDLEASTSSGNLTYPQVGFNIFCLVFNILYIYFF